MITRDLNYRDTDPTKITEKTKNILFFVDGTHATTEDEVREAMDYALKLITKFSGGKVEKVFYSFEKTPTGTQESPEGRKEQEILDQDTLVVGRIEKIKKHPNANKLMVCEVDIGERKVTSLTTCSNTRKGMLVPVFLPGSKYFDWKGSRKILQAKESKIRGVKSEAIMGAAEEIGIHVPKDKREPLYELKKGRLGDKVSKHVKLG